MIDVEEPDEWKQTFKWTAADVYQINHIYQCENVQTIIQTFFADMLYTE